MCEIRTLTITETNSGEDGWTTSLRLCSGEKTIFERSNLQIRNPYSDTESTNLNWYFQESLENPFVESVKFDKTARSILTYGESFFQQLFSGPEDQDIYSQYLSEDMSLRIVIHGGPMFQSLHWEALKHPSHNQPFSLRAAFERHVCDPTTSFIPRLSVSRPSKLKLLVVVARPKGTQDVDYRSISRPLIDCLSQSHLDYHADLVRPGTVSALEAQLSRRPRGFYDVVHFDLHGIVTNYGPSAEGRVEPYQGAKAFLLFQLEDGRESDWVSADRVANILTRHGVKATIINACQSSRETGEPEGSLATVLSRSGISFVLGMCYNVTIGAAVTAVVTMYTAFAQGKSWSECVADARQDMWRNKERTAYYGRKVLLEDWLLPVAYVNAQVVANSTGPPDDYHASLGDAEPLRPDPAFRYRGPQPLYDFVGRDIDILEVERRLLGNNGSNQLIIKGMMAVGKTSLLHHLAEWWQKTGLVEKVFYFEYREQAWTVPLLLSSIARQFYPHASEEYQKFDASPASQQQQVVVEWLRTTRHLLILDNMEAISMKNSNAQLSYKNMAALARFLNILSGTKSINLLGSRNDLEWLHFPDEKIYSLGGLDLPAASLLVSRILQKLGKGDYIGDPCIRELTDRLLDSPLALQMVLANVAQKRPRDILDTVNGGLFALDHHEGSMQNPQFLHSCIQYAYTNLPEQYQNLLLCLAPFVCHLVEPDLIDYGKVLGNQRILAAFPTTSFPYLLRSIEYTGLISFHGANRDWLIMQPVLPAFLRDRLHGMPEISAAIDGAFCEHLESVMRRLNNAMTTGRDRERRNAEDLVGFQFDSTKHALELRLKSGRGFLMMLETLNIYLRRLSHTQRGIEFSIRMLSILGEMSGREIIPFEVGALYFWAGKWMMWRRNYVDAEEVFRSALTLLENTDSNSSRLAAIAISNIYECLGNIRMKQGKLEEAEAQYNKAFVSRAVQEPDEAVTRGVLALRRRDWGLASELFGKAQKESLDRGDLEGETSILHLFNLATAEFGKENWESAKDLYMDALKLCDKYQDVHKAADVHYELARIMHVQGNDRPAHEHVSDALATYTMLQMPDKRANCYCLLAAIAREAKEWEQAEEYCLKAIEIVKDDRVDRAHAGLAYSAYGETLRPQGKRGAAQAQYETAYEMFNPGRLRAGTAWHLGIMANANKQYSKAKEYFVEAYEYILDESTELPTKAAFFFELSDAFLRDMPPNVPMAERLYWQALAYYIHLGDTGRRQVVERRLKLVVSAVSPACRSACDEYDAILGDEDKMQFALNRVTGSGIELLLGRDSD